MDFLKGNLITLHRIYQRASDLNFTDMISKPSLSCFVHDCLFSAVAVTRFPRPASPLQDVAVIVGSREQLAVLLQLYNHQLEHEGTTGWETLLWVVNQL